MCPLCEQVYIDSLDVNLPWREPRLFCDLCSYFTDSKD